MPKVSRDSATGGGEFGPVTDRNETIDGTEIVQFSPAGELELTEAAMRRNMKEMQTA